MFNKVIKSVAVDIIDSPVSNYCRSQAETEFIQINSQSNEFKNYMKTNSFDLIFIDGDHSYEGVSNDYNISKDSGHIYMFFMT